MVTFFPHLTLAVADARALGFAEPQAVVATITEIKAARTATSPTFFNMHALLIGTCSLL
jgi:hypothetical protein